LIDRYKISITGKASDDELLKGAYIVLLNAVRIPPHIAIAVNGKLFSLDVKGSSVDVDLRSTLRIIQQRNVGCVFTRLNIPAYITIDRLEEEIKRCVLAYPRVDIGVATCLAPVKDVFRSLFSIDVDKVRFIYELLPLLEEKKLIKGYYHANLDDKLENNAFYLQKYSLNDIEKEIREIKNGELRIKS
jgi:hypothetical protein